MSSFCVNQLVFTPYFLKTVIDVKFSGLPHVSKLVVGGKCRHAP